MACWNVIDHEELTGSAAAWTSVTIPSTYDHLHLVVSARTDDSVDYAATLIQFNGDTGGNYSSTDLYTFSSFALGTGRTSGISGIGYAMLSGATTTADTFGIMDVWIPNYANTSNYKSLTCNSAAVNTDSTSGNFQSRVSAGMWSSTAAITSVKVLPNIGNLVQYSSFTLYGINGAG